MQRVFMTTALVASAAQAMTLSNTSYPSLTELSQTEAANNRECDFSHDRNKEAQTNFYSLVNRTNQYTDSNFPKNDAIYWSDGGTEEYQS